MARKDGPAFETCKTIGIAGACPAVGVTHLSILAANYLTGVRGQSAAVLEWNQSKSFLQMEHICCGSQGHGFPEGHSFRVFEVDYYAMAQTSQLLLCRHKEYHRIMMDFGVLTADNQNEFLRCDQRILVGAMSEWQLEAFLELSGRMLWAEKERILYMAAFGSEEIRKNMRQRLRQTVRRIPISVDAFTITAQIIRFFDSWLL